MVHQKCTKLHHLVSLNQLQTAFLNNLLIASEAFIDAELHSNLHDTKACTMNSSVSCQAFKAHQAAPAVAVMKVEASK
jgi:hypothetical protein